MCGIALILGPAAADAEDRFAGMLAALAPRGEVRETHRAPGLLAGTQRLRIVDRDAAVQPWTSEDGRWVLCYNGELFNYRELGAQLAALGTPPAGNGDTAVLAAAFAQWGEQAVSRFRGEFAFAIADTTDQRLYLARDPLGVKPLYWARSGGALHVASEIKALVPLGQPVHEVPPGHHGWAGAAAGPDLGAYTGLAGGPNGTGRAGRGAEIGAEPVTDPAEAAKLVRAAFEDSVRVRVDTDLPVGVILSGGLDSSLTLLHVAQMHPDCVAFTIGAPGSDDLRYARRLCAELGVRHEVVELAPRQIGRAEIRAAIEMSELTEYGDIINAVVSVPLFRRVRDAGVKVVLTGDGSDELFGGYAMYHRASPHQARRLFLHKIRNLARTELQRVDRTSMGHGVEARVPFLDPALVELALALPMDLKVRDGREKWILREAFADLLPGYIRDRPKNPMSHSSGLHERARLYKPLFPGIHRFAGYDRCAPVRRDFSAVLEAAGQDLDLAAAQLAARPDYSAGERARDFAGALKWNALALARGAGRARKPAG
ncbi:MAG TPA: asparagine synthase-related protein [Streptosporangiaceae bacterium]|nr:asparagine synthase-related protein [Streptosporangiaceae bacterium]